MSVATAGEASATPSADGATCDRFQGAPHRPPPRPRRLRRRATAGRVSTSGGGSALVHASRITKRKASGNTIRLASGNAIR
eukprot:scaffold15003_cov100-Isochrysis_galbana.AAC.1